MLQKVYSAGLIGVDPIVVEVEIHTSKGLNAFEIVGLPETAVRESRVRVKSAIQNSGFEFPKKRVVVNLAPADIKKIGSAYDLPIAVGILALMNVIPSKRIKNWILYGELGLDGSIKSTHGVLPVAIGVKKHGYQGIVVSDENAVEASYVKGIKTISASNLRELSAIISGRIKPHTVIPISNSEKEENSMDMSDIRGQEFAKRAMEVAAAGGHNILLVGPPGSGKTMLARRLPTILPTMTEEESLETTKIYSVKGVLSNQGLISKRPFRAPHHTISDVAMIGGGSNPKPGEVSLAHNGVLFLDEFPEFKRNVLEVLRQPLEDKFVTIARSSYTVKYPASFMLVAAMNPCPCGYFGDKEHVCTCSSYQIERYRAKISGPLLDRIDIQIEVPALPLEKLRIGKKGESSLVIRKRVEKARKIQRERFKDLPIHNNAMMNVSQIERFCKLSDDVSSFLEKAVKALKLSARAYHGILKVARTVADLEGSEKILFHHVSEAIQYRGFDRFLTN